MPTDQMLHRRDGQPANPPTSNPFLPSANPDQLHSAFCDFIEAQRRDKVLGPELIEPAFFFPDIVPMGDSRETSQMPFPSFWLVVRLPAFEVAHVADIGPNEDGTRKMKCKFYRRRDGVWFDAVFEKLEPLARLVNNLILQINIHEAEEVESARLTSINRGRAKSNSYLAPIPKFITVKSTVRSDDQRKRGEGDGSTRIPHDRRGHYRNLSNGKRIWINAMAIHGGSKVPRDYIVKK